ncbi:MAG: FAD-dependent oxidoreductase [Corynebacterium variabile]|uniref:FAD-dependent oxidoreductase n=1 Tax=Corynebacterium variabile TaxID=1727 RepID=UPI003F93F33E
MRITVIGAGVTGLSCARELAGAGHEVTVVADHGPGDTVSARAGALWFPYDVTVENAPDLEKRSLIRFVELAGQAEAAQSEGADDVTDDIAPVEMRRGFLRERLDPPDRSWVPTVTEVLGEDAATEVEREGAQGAERGVETTLPLIMTPTYLAWLMDSCRIAGVAFRWKTVESLDLLVKGAYNTAPPEAVIICGGLRGGELLGGDDEVTPVRGQVIVFANGSDDEDGDGGEDGGPVLTDWYVDDDDPENMTYVFPRVDDIVVGGIAEVGNGNEDPDAETAEAILARAEALVPALKELPILGHGAGLRPSRSSLRIEQVDTDEVSIPVIAAYGHGGAGVTLSWGTAERVAEMVEQL